MAASGLHAQRGRVGQSHRRLRNRPMKTHAILSVAVTLLALTSPLRAGVKSIDLPADGVVLKPSPLPGYAKAQAICSACHSAEYMHYQPASAPRAARLLGGDGQANEGGVQGPRGRRRHPAHRRLPGQALRQRTAEVKSVARLRCASAPRCLPAGGRKWSAYHYRWG